MKQQVDLPDEDDDGGRLGHGSDHAAHTDNTQEGEEGLLTAWTGTLPRERHGVLTGAGYTGTAGQVLTRRQETRWKCHLTVNAGMYSRSAVCVFNNQA